MTGTALPSASAATPTQSLATAGAPEPKIAPPETATGAVVETVLTEALPVPDMVFGGSMLVLVIMFHAFWIRLITSSFLKRSRSEGAHTRLWRADLLFAATVVALLSLHMAEVFVWSVALVNANIVDGWAKASYFAANCYTALGEPFSLPHAWRLLPPIIAISGIFTFAWTASVLVNFVARYNDLRAETLARREKVRDDATKTAGPRA
jgi:hypothetical protein